LRHDLATKQPALAQVPATVDLAPPVSRSQGSALPGTHAFGSEGVGAALLSPRMAMPRRKAWACKSCGRNRRQRNDGG
jgi:hypothetical protein